MQQPKETLHSSENLTTEKLKEYRANLDGHLQNRKVDKEVLKRAWCTAHQVATFLFKDFSATQVAVFGSLAEGKLFSKESDIDIVVWGLSGDIYLDAAWKTSKYSSEFKIDLVNYHSSNGRFRDRINSQAILIHRLETDSYTSSINDLIQYNIKEKPYIVDKLRLIERITDERRKIEQTVEEIRLRLHRMDTVSTEDLADLKALIAMRIPIFYTGVENIFKRIAREIDNDTPKGKNWHKELLNQMATTHQLRPRVVSPESTDTLTHILKFRHRFRNIYVFEMELEGVIENAHRVCNLSEMLMDELDMFIEWLHTDSFNG